MIRAPKTAPAYAPYTGTRAVMPVSTPTAAASGRRKMSIPAVQRLPIMAASVTCALMKRENALLARLAMWIILFTVLSLKTSEMSVFT